MTPRLKDEVKLRVALPWLGSYRVVKRNCQVEKIVNLGHPNDFMTQKSRLIFVKTILG